MNDTHDNRARLSEAAELLAGEACIWCELAPKTRLSHLCDRCCLQDTDGALRRPFQLQVVSVAA